MLKAQILAGGRGKGKYDSDGKGGVRIVNWSVSLHPRIMRYGLKLFQAERSIPERLPNARV